MVLFKHRLQYNNIGYYGKGSNVATSSHNATGMRNLPKVPFNQPNHLIPPISIPVAQTT